jgi:hypothetical protein
MKQTLRTKDLAPEKGSPATPLTVMELCMIRLCDKYDNLQSLSNNPDLSVKRRYVEELRRYGLSLSGYVVPRLKGPLSNELRAQMSKLKP